MCAAKRICDLGETLETAMQGAREIDEIRGGRAEQDKYFRWVTHYRDGQKLTAHSGKLKTGRDLDLSSDSSNRPPSGPTEIHNSKRHALKHKIDKHNADNDRYNANYPHLKDSMKREPFDYINEKDVEKRLTPEILPLPSLEKALEEKIWKSHVEMQRRCPPARDGIPINRLDKIFSQGPVHWVWNAHAGYWDIDFTSWYDPPNQ